MTSSPTMTRDADVLDPTRAAPERARRVFSALAGLSALAVLLQGLWAGIFLQHDGQRDKADNWVQVHARGGEVALLLAVLALAWAVLKLRSRRDLQIGAAVLAALLVTESYIGGLIGEDNQDTLTAVHIPLAMAIMAVAVWLPLRARRRA